MTMDSAGMRLNSLDLLKFPNRGEKLNRENPGRDWSRPGASNTGLGVFPDARLPWGQSGQLYAVPMVCDLNKRRQFRNVRCNQPRLIFGDQRGRRLPSIKIGKQAGRHD